MACVYIPEELEKEILKRLPTKSLCRFQSVCKSWRSLIVSPFFCHYHQSFVTATKANKPTTYLRRHEKDICIFYRQDNTIIQPTNFPFAKTSLVHPFYLLQVIHGIIVAFSFSNFKWLSIPRLIVFWNPAIRRHIPAPLPLKEIERHEYSMGAGFDASNNDFKAVCIPCVMDIEYYYVFSARTGEWRKIKCSLLGCRLTYCSMGCFFNGAIYWIASKFKERKYYHDELVYFDCESEVFMRMELPKRVSYPIVFLYGGSLSIITKGDIGLTWGLWTMKELGVWTKLSTPTDGAFSHDPCVIQESMFLLDIGKPCQNLHNDDDHQVGSLTVSGFGVTGTKSTH